MTRPDISMSVSKLCSFSHCAGQRHLDAAFVVMGYLVKTKHLGITFGGRLRVPYGLTEMPTGFIESGGLWIAHDSSWGGEAKPMAGHVVMYNNGPLTWAANGLKIVPMSTCESEASEGSRAAKTGMFARNLAVNNNRRVLGPTALLGDNKALYEIMHQEGASTRTRYYERATLFIKRAVQLLVFLPYLIKTTDMIADIFTKACEKGTFIKLRNVMMNNNQGLRNKLEHSLTAIAGASKRLAEHLLAKI